VSECRQRLIWVVAVVLFAVIVFLQREAMISCSIGYRL
jgi:hypothetical protein